MGDLLELAARVEKATGADSEMRSLNRDILVGLGWRNDNGYAIDPAGNLAFQVPYYVGSLDAAMKLVPEGLSFRIYYHPHESHSDIYSLHPSKGIIAEAEQAATPALALTAASLRARAAAEAGDANDGK